MNARAFQPRQRHLVGRGRERRIARLDLVRVDQGLAVHAERPPVLGLLPETDLVASELRYRTVVEQTGQMVYDIDVPSGRIQWFGDDAITNITGDTPEEFAAWVKKQSAQWTRVIRDGNIQPD